MRIDWLRGEKRTGWVVSHNDMSSNKVAEMCDTNGHWGMAVARAASRVRSYSECLRE